MPGFGGLFFLFSFILWNKTYTTKVISKKYSIFYYLFQAWFKIDHDDRGEGLKTSRLDPKQR